VSETIRRVKDKTGNFTVVSNEVFRRSDLSARAKGIYAYIMTLPDDWLVCKQELYTHFAEGKAALDTGFKELETAGYINKRLLRDGQGHITATEYTVFESAEMNDAPKSENRKTVKPPKSDLPFSGYPISVNRTLLSTDTTKNLKELSSGGTSTTELLKECVKVGFYLDEKIAGQILSENPIDSSWISGAFSFPEFIASVIAGKYGNQPPDEQKSLFIRGLGWWLDRRAQYPAWREQRKKEAQDKQRRYAAETEKHRIAEARRNPPAVCGHCGTALAPDIRACPSCGWMRNFDADSGAWSFDEPVDIVGMFEEVINKGRPKGASP
jgi:hypothetical protein